MRIVPLAGPSTSSHELYDAENSTNTYQHCEPKHLRRAVSTVGRDSEYSLDKVHFDLLAEYLKNLTVCPNSLPGVHQGHLRLRRSPLTPDGQNRLIELFRTVCALFPRDTAENAVTRETLRLWDERLAIGR
jgi:hypothetical protein